MDKFKELIVKEGNGSAVYSQEEVITEQQLFSVGHSIVKLREDHDTPRKEGSVMAVKDAIYGRRSIRKYIDQAIACEDLEDILKAGIMAPSAMNLQQWHFVMVQDKVRIEETREIMSKVFDTFKPVLTERFAKHPHIVHETGDFMKSLGGAPAILLAFISRKDYNNSIPALSGVCAAIENMLLAAYEKGIGSCWLTAPITAHMENEFERRFAPGKGRFVAFVTLGYPNENPPVPPRRSGKYEIL